MGISPRARRSARKKARKRATGYYTGSRIPRWCRRIRLNGPGSQDGRRGSSAGRSDAPMQTRPVERGTGIGLAAWGDVAVSDDRFYGISPARRSDESRQRLVLRCQVTYLVGTLQFDADREIVALCAAAPRRGASMPRALRARDELHQAAIATDEKVRRDLLLRNRGEIGVRGGVKRVGEEAYDAIAAEFSWGQRNPVHDDQRYRRSARPVVAIGGRDPRGDRRQAVRVDDKPPRPPRGHLRSRRSIRQCTRSIMARIHDVADVTCQYCASEIG